MSRKGKQQPRPRRQHAIIQVEVLHPMTPTDLRVVVPAQASDEEIQREIVYLLGPCPEGRWHWRCLSPAGPVKARLMTHPTRTPFRERR